MNKGKESTASLRSSPICTRERVSALRRRLSRGSQGPAQPTKRIKDLPPTVGLLGVRFIYPGDGKAYYWYSQWQKGVWGRKRMEDSQMFPLFCDDLKDALPAQKPNA
jgi:hypothetical protein